MWVSDTATHFKNRVIAQLSDALKVDHRFAVAYTPWSNGTCDRMRFRLGFCLVVKLVRLMTKQALGVL